MTGKRLTFVVEITIGTFNEQLQTKETADEFVEALTEGIKGFTKEIAVASDGQLVGSIKILEQSTDWQ